MFWIFDKYEREMRSGKLSPSTYRRLLDAEIYGAASSMGHLETQLYRLKAMLSSGGFTVTNSVGKTQKISTKEQFYDWVSHNFPDAYKCFFEYPRHRG
jgi:hypothetical protein